MNDMVKIIIDCDIEKGEHIDSMESTYFESGNIADISKIGDGIMIDVDGNRKVVFNIKELMNALEYLDNI